jgi:hypothetical protein
MRNKKDSEATAQAGPGLLCGDPMNSVTLCDLRQLNVAICQLGELSQAYYADRSQEKLLALCGAIGAVSGMGAVVRIDFEVYEGTKLEEERKEQPCTPAAKSTT